MSSTGATTAPEVLGDANLDQVLEKRIRQEQEGTRERRIRRAGYLWSCRKVLAKFAAWGAAASVVIAVLIPSQFTSTTRLMPPDTSQGQGLAMFAAAAGKLGGNLAALGNELLGLKTSDDLFAGVLLSRTVQDDVIAKFDLRKVYRERRWVDTRKELTRNTDIAIDRKSGILTIQVTDHDPKRACAMAQEYVTQLNYVVTQLNTSSAHRERVFLEERLAEVKQELQTSEKEFSQFASKTGAIDIKEQGKAMVEAAALLEGQLIAAQTELQGLRQIFTDNNVRVRALKARVNELELQIRKVGGTASTAEDTASSDNAVYPSIRKLPLLGVTYADLYRHTKVEEVVFETLTQQYELAKVQEAKEVPSVKILDPADVPEKKVFPPRTLLVLTGTFVALVLGVLWVLLSDRWAKTDPQDPGKLLVLEVVSSVKPQLAYAIQQRTALTDRTKSFLDRFGAEVATAETKQEQ
jgi:capsule polysaccharide export protein KpsE/RkpR